MTVLPTAEPRPYTLAQLRQMLGLSRHTISRLVDLGFVHPARGPGHTLQFSFRDLVLLRSAHDLREAGIATRQILRSLQTLKRSLPADLPLGDLRVTAMGDRIAVRRTGDDAAPWDAGSGQRLLDFSVEATPGALTFLRPTTSAADSASDAHAPPLDGVDAAYRAAERLEDSDPAAAEAAYRRVLAAAPAHAHALLNLGFLYCEAGRFQEAADLYRGGALACPDDPLVHYNRGVALQALQHPDEALASYEAALRLQPDLADAHQNAALLYVEVGQPQMAIRHFSAYRRLQRAIDP